MNEQGAVMVEYVLIATLIAIAAILGAQLIGPAVSDILESVAGWF